MKSNQKLAIMFWLKRSKATKDGMAPIYARITIDGKEEEISLSRKAKPIYWDTNLKRVTEGSSDARTTNLKIAQTENDLNRHFIVLQSQHDKISPLMLKNVYSGLPALYNSTFQDLKEETPTQTLLGAYDAFISKFERQVLKEQRSYETLKHWRSTRVKVEAFIHFQYGLNDIELADIRYSFALKFYDYMTLEVDEPLAEISAKKHIKKTKQILNGCLKDDLITKNPLKEFVCSGGEQEVEPLEMAQVHKLYEKKLTIDRLIEVRDAFIFQAYETCGRTVKT